MIILEYLKFRPKKAHTKRAFQKYQSIRTNQSGREITAGAKAENEFKKHSEKLAELLGIPKEMTFCSTLDDRLSSFIKNYLKNHY